MDHSKISEIESLSIPLVKCLKENFNPHFKILITSDKVELLGTEVGIPTKNMKLK